MTDSVDIFLNCYKDIENNISLDVQKHRSRYYEFDHSHKSILSEVEIVSQKAETLSSSDEKFIKTLLMQSMDLAEKKLGVSERILSIVNDSMLKLDKSITNIDATKVCKNQQKKLLEWARGTEDSDSASTEILSTPDVTSSDERLKSDSSSKMSGVTFSESDQDNNEHENSESQHSKSSSSSSSSSSESSVEPTYCICEEISYGDMVCCDNDLCPLEWFHFNCVALTKKPKGKWYCPMCRGTNSRRMKSRKTFLKELEEYNKRKEENFK